MHQLLPPLWVRLNMIRGVGLRLMVELWIRPRHHERLKPLRILGTPLGVLIVLRVLLRVRLVRLLLLLLRVLVLRVRLVRLRLRVRLVRLLLLLLLLQKRMRLRAPLSFRRCPRAGLRRWLGWQGRLVWWQGRLVWWQGRLEQLG